MIRTILVPVDGSAHALAAVDFAAEIGAACKAKIVVLHVMSRTGSYQVPEELRDLARIEHVDVTEHDLLRGAAERIVAVAQARIVGKLAAVETSIQQGDPASTIVEAARKTSADLIVMGRRGLGDLKGLLLGSVSHKVAQLADCACATVK